MSLHSMMNREVDVYRLQASTTVDEIGGASTPTWKCIYRRVKCRFNAMTTRDLALVWDKKTVFGNYYCYMEYRPDIKEGDRFYLGNRIFEVKLRMEWDEARNFIKFAVMEVR